MPNVALVCRGSASNGYRQMCPPSNAALVARGRMACERASAVRLVAAHQVEGTVSSRAESQSKPGPISWDQDAKLWPPEGKIIVRT